MITGSIYLIINKDNGHKYVGQTIQALNKEWQQHIKEAMMMSNKPLHCAMRKYGNHIFSIKQIDECDQSILDEKETYWIERYNCEYNRTIEIEVIEEKEEPVVIIEKKKDWGFHISKNRGSGITSRIKVLGINIETGEEKIWESASSAAKDVANNSRYGHNILSASRNGWSAYGYRWKLIGNKSNRKRVYGVHRKTWEETPIYESTREAIRNHTNKSIGTGLSKSLKNPHKYTWKGYYWFYADRR
jgi:hypothetical protein